MSADRPRLGRRIFNEVVHAPGDVARGASSELTYGTGIGGALLVEGVVGGVVGLAVGLATRNPELGLAAGTATGSGVIALLLGITGSYMRHNPKTVLEESDLMNS